MVTFENVGRMGNFLFEFAAAYAYALDHGLDFTVPTFTKSPKWNPIYFSHLFNPKWDPSLRQTILEERKFTYEQLPFSESWRQDNILIKGYRQNEKYFKHRREELLKVMGFRWFAIKGWVSVHVRRGDYLTIKKGEMFKHPPVPKVWILEQMMKFSGFQFMFFSDDIEWCKQEFEQYEGVFFSEGFTESQDLEHMSRLEHHICSASTYSWWGAWLNQNPNKRVIMPQHWITPGWSNLDFSDIVPAEWERV